MCKKLCFCLKIRKKQLGKTLLEKGCMHEDKSEVIHRHEGGHPQRFYLSTDNEQVIHLKMWIT